MPDGGLDGSVNPESGGGKMGSKLPKSIRVYDVAKFIWSPVECIRGETPRKE